MVSFHDKALRHTSLTISARDLAEMFEDCVSVFSGWIVTKSEAIIRAIHCQRLDTLSVMQLRFSQTFYWTFEFRFIVVAEKVTGWTREGFFFSPCQWNVCQTLFNKTYNHFAFVYSRNWWNHRNRQGLRTESLLNHQLRCWRFFERILKKLRLN